MRRTTLALLCLGLLGGLLAWYSIPRAARAGARDDCRPSGVWLDTFAEGTSILYTITPIAPGGRRFAISGSPSGIALDVGGLFPDATASTEFRGTIARVGRNEYAFTIRRLVTNAAGALLYTQAASGIAELSDCDTIRAAYTNEFIGADGATALCVPGTSIVLRQRIKAPCADLPPLP